MTNNLKLSDNVYLGKDIKNPEKMLKKLHKGKSIKQYYFVIYNTLFNRIEILNSRVFLQKYFREQEYVFYAVFTSENEAYEYVRCVTSISYSKYDEFRPKEALEFSSIEDIDNLFGKEDKE